MHGIDVIHLVASPSLDNGIHWKAASNGHQEMLCSLCDVWIDLGKTIMGEVGMVNHRGKSKCCVQMSKNLMDQQTICRDQIFKKQHKALVRLSASSNTLFRIDNSRSTMASPSYTLLILYYHTHTPRKHSTSHYYCHTIAKLDIL